MHRAILVLLLGMSLAFTPATMAAGKKPTTQPTGGERTIQGMLQSVQGNTLTISLLKKKGELKERKIRVGKGAKVTLNGNPSGLGNLKAGENVTVHMAHGSAKDIAATSK